MSDIHDDHTDFQADIDLDIEKAGIQAYYSEFLIAGRPAPPMAIFWRGQKRVLSVICRPWEDERDKHKAIMNMLYMSPAIQSSTLVLAMEDPVKLSDKIARCVVMVTATCQGALSAVSPYTIDDENNTIEFAQDAEPDGKPYSEIIQHMLGVFSRMRRPLVSGPKCVEFLSAKGYEVQFFGDESMETISTYNV